jgi:acylphosphatase
MNAEALEWHAIVTGKVQGVGFRATTLHTARRLGLKGIVRNLPDGSVEIYAQGKREDIDQLKQELQQLFGLTPSSFREEISVICKAYSDFEITFK